MTEKEKCAAGMLYDANYDAALLKERDQRKDICFEYNNTPPSQLSSKKSLLRRLFGKTADDFTIQAPFWCDYGYNIELGKNFYANHNLVILDGAKVTFGDNVWIGAGVQVCPGVTIGSNVVIGAGSVVTKNIPDNVVAVGNPCRVLRSITEEEVLREYARKV